MPPLPKLSPIDLLQVSAPFDDPDFLYEVKFDGFRALAYVDDGLCELVSRKGHVYRRFADLCQSTFGLLTRPRRGERPGGGLRSPATRC